MDSKKKIKPQSASHTLTYDLSIKLFLETIYWKLRVPSLIPEVAEF